MISKRFFFLFMLTVSARLLFAQSNYDDIRELLRITHSRENYIANAKELIEYYKKIDTTVPESYWDEFSKELDNSYTELDSALVVIYARHFTNDEIRQLIDFYKTKVGQKSLAIGPRIAAESNAAGKLIGLKISEKILLGISSKNAAIDQKKKNKHLRQKSGWWTRYKDKRRFKKGKF
jgi:hypothetical protein